MIDIEKLMGIMKEINDQVDKTNQYSVIKLFSDEEKDSYQRLKSFNQKNYAFQRMGIQNYIQDDQILRNVPDDRHLRSYYNKFQIKDQLTEISNFYENEALDYKYCLLVSRKYDNVEEESENCMETFNNKHKDFNSKFEDVMRRRYFNLEKI